MRQPDLIRSYSPSVSLGGSFLSTNFFGRLRDERGKEREKEKKRKKLF
jgi:hypothetical protein